MPPTGDKRFSGTASNPKFHKTKKNQQKVVLDDRFKDLFDFQSTSKVDKFGRKVKPKDGAHELKQFYNINKDDEKAAKKERQQRDQLNELEQPQQPKSAMDYARGEAIMEDSDSDSSSDSDSVSDSASSDSSADDEVELQPENYENQLVGSDDEDEDSDDDDNDDDEIPQSLNDDEIKDEMRRLDAQAKAYNENAEDGDDDDTIDFTSRLAVTNLDWDHLSAQDIYVALDSILQGTEHKKALKNVSVYMSQFGKNRIEHEEQSGPTLIGANKTKKGKERQLDPESALREYQLGRLRYYYAIVTLSSSKAAHKLFSEAHNTEIERTANILQFQVVPDGVAFEEDDIRDQANTSSESYRGVDFQTPALRHSKVKLTWDEDDDKRVALTRKRMNKEDIEQNDFKAYLASESEDESENEQENQRRAALLRAALSGEQGDARELRGGKKDREGEMEVTFAPGLSEKNTKKGKDSDGDENMTTLERYKKKEKAKKDAKKDKRKNQMQDDDSEHQEQMEQQEKPSDQAGFDDDFFQSGSEDEAAFDNRAAEDDRAAIAKPYKKDERKSKIEDKEDAQDSGRVESTADELKLLTNEKDDAKHFDMDDIIKSEKKQGRKRKHNKKSKGNDDGDAEDNFEINVDDDRFKNVLEDHQYAIDPTLPNFKPTKSMKKLLAERSRRSQRDGDDVAANNAPSIDSLIQSVKSKSKKSRLN